MGREDADGALGDFLLALDEDGTLLLQAAHHVKVVDDLLADVHRRPVACEAALDDFDGALDSRTPATGRRDEDLPRHHNLPRLCWPYPGGA